MKPQFVIAGLLIMAITSTAAETPIDLVRRASKATSASEAKELTARALVLITKLGRLSTSATEAMFILVRPDVRSAAVAGDWTQWKPTVPLRQIWETDVWFAIAKFPRGTRLEYKFVVDGECICDTLHPNRYSVAPGHENSWFVMPGYKPRKLEPGPRTPRGTLTTIRWDSAILGNQRDVPVYLPHGHSLDKAYRAIVFHDGMEYLNRTGIQGVLDELIARKRIPPTIGVFIQPIQRIPEYWTAADKYGRAIVTELLPKVEKLRNAKPGDRRYVSCGVSLGGYVSLFLALNFGGTFDRVISQSGAFSADKGGLSERAREHGAKGQRWWLDFGAFEQDLTDHNRLMAKWAAGMSNVKTVEEPNAHNWTAWAERLPAALEWTLR